MFAEDVFDFDFHEKPFHVVTLTVEEFLIGMSSLGPVPELSMVGSFAKPDDQTVRTAHRDVDLPLHRDGVFTQSIADMQGGNYIAKPGVDVVGMYCVRDNKAPCYTTLSADGENIDAEVDLRAGQALIWDNRLSHGRRGAVGQRLLIRFWSSLRDRSLLPEKVAPI
jgi:hypothetical protein